MDKRLLVMKWDYDYNKEGTWFDEEHGEEEYELTANAAYPLPHLRGKCLEIRSVTKEDGIIKAEIYADYETHTVTYGAKPTVAYAHDSYSVAGDSVSQSLRMELEIR